jgi:outer membrane protein TolC
MAQAGHEQARIMVNSLNRAVEAECESAYTNLTAAGEAYLAQADNVRVAERALQIAEVSFENEMMTSVELMDSQLALTMARQNYYQSLYDYLVALAQIEKAIGQALEY